MIFGSFGSRIGTFTRSYRTLQLEDVIHHLSTQHSQVAEDVDLLKPGPGLLTPHLCIQS